MKPDSRDCIFIHGQTIILDMGRAIDAVVFLNMITKKILHIKMERMLAINVMIQQ
jgi:hypothetical protein